MTQNFVVRFETWEAYNCETKEEAVQKATKEYGENIDIISVTS